MIREVNYINHSNRVTHVSYIQCYSCYPEQFYLLMWQTIATQPFNYMLKAFLCSEIFTLPMQSVKSHLCLAIIFPFSLDKMPLAVTGT